MAESRTVWLLTILSESRMNSSLIQMGHVIDQAGFTAERPTQWFFAFHFILFVFDYSSNDHSKPQLLTNIRISLVLLISVMKSIVAILSI